MLQVRRILLADGELRHPRRGQECLCARDGRRQGHAQGLLQAFPRIGG